MFRAILAGISVTVPVMGYLLWRIRACRTSEEIKTCLAACVNERAIARQITARTLATLQGAFNASFPTPHCWRQRPTARLARAA